MRAFHLPAGADFLNRAVTEMGLNAVLVPHGPEFPGMPACIKAPGGSSTGTTYFSNDNSSIKILGPGAPRRSSFFHMLFLVFS